MLKNKLTILLLLSVLTVGAFAQSIPSGMGRMIALGNSPFILDASTDIFNNPAWNNHYQHYAFGDLNQFGESEDFDGNAGVTFRLNNKWNLGMIVNKRQDNWSLMAPVGSGGDSVKGPIVPFMVLIGYSASKNFHLGLAPYVSMWSAEQTNTDTNGTVFDKSSSSLGANLGFIYKIKKGWIEGAFKFRMDKYKSVFTSSEKSNGATTTTTRENDGGIELGANFRGWIYPSKGSQVALVPLLGFYSFSYTPKVTVGTTATTGNENSWLDLNGGVGLNWPISDDIQIAGGVLVNYNSSKSTFSDTTGTSETKVTEFIAPLFNMALETRIADWLTARLGFNKGINKFKFDQTIISSTYTYNESFANNSSTVDLGAGFHFGRFSVDATVSESWLKGGMNFISGASTDLFGVISASYNFAK